MASNKKPSMYSDHGKIGSAEELEAYGVWVKSEPQDFTATLETANFDADALPYEADFDTGFDDMGTTGFGSMEPDLTIPEMSISDDDDGIMTDAERGSEEASTQLLMKIAGELSSIRSELNTLKKEFAEIRGESGGGGTESTDLFSGEEDEDGKIALSGDEMDSFFTSAGLSEDELGFDPGREADEAALKELSEQDETEEIHIDFDNLGIDLDGVEAEAEVEAEAPQEELPSLESLVDDDDFAIPSFDTLSFEEAPPSEPDDSEEAQGFAEELVPLEEEDDKELQALRLEGAESLVSPPDNADYLEEDPFALDDTALEPTALEPAAPLDESALGEDLTLEPAVEEPALEEPVVEEPVAEPALEEPVVEETVEEPALEELVVEEPVAEPALEELVVEEPVVEEPVLEEPALAETEIEEAQPEEAAPEAATTVSESPDITFDELSFDETSFDLDLDGLSADSPPAPAEEKVAENSEPLPDIDAIDEPGPSEETAEPPLEETVEEPALGDISFEDDLSLDMDDFGTDSADAKTEQPEADVESDAPTDALAANEFDLGTIELDAPVDDQIDDLGTVDLGEDIALDTQIDDLGTVDFGADLEPALPEIKDTAKAVAKPAAPANDIISDVDDSIIPEGFEVNAKEADPSVDDDLEAFAGELAITGDESPSDGDDKLTDEGGEFAAIPAGLKNELKNVLSYMDHLLESLPEDKIEEFAQSEYFDKYKKIFKELGLV